jgi:hypothetical protein
MKVIRLTHGCGVVKNTGNYESVRIYNEVEVTINEGDSIKDAHVKLREAVEKLNKQDLDKILGE